MLKIKKANIFIILIATLVLFFTWISFTQPGVGDLKGDFRQVAVYRNENNTGPIIRIYAVTVADTLWGEMRKYGDLMLHTKYGNTKVYFFLNQDPTPEKLYPGEQNFDDQYNQYYIAKYEKNNMGEVVFLRNENTIVQEVDRVQAVQ